MAETAVFAPDIPVWVDLSTPDIEGAKQFYSKLFGWAPEVVPDPDAGGYTFFKLNGKQVAAAGPQQGPGQPPAWSIYIGTENADTTAKKVKDAGGKVVAEPFDVMDVGRMAVFQDPTGAYFSVWQAGKHKGAEITNQPNAFAWAELNTRGIASAKPFYKKVFGWGDKSSPTGEGAPPYTEWQVGGSSIGGGMEFSKDIPANIPPYWLTYFGVSDPDATAKKASELGGKVTFGPQDFPGGRFAVLTDPQGASFGILRMNP